ncbi:putative ribosomal RNA small subunit methyltransferase A [uncultured archaeon]|nr:putative ribosomal RNA small subunit methyltransferase A [uncultured archaeon]
MRRIGQNFLVDRDVLLRIADYAELNPVDNVLEIGAGTGNLTEVLSRRAGRVYAVEVDSGLTAGLKGRFANVKNVKVIDGDALKVELPDYSKIVSNLPYQISSKITYRLLSKPFDLAVLMYQKEFAKRLIAAPGTTAYGRLSMVVGHYARAEILEYVSRTAFRPNPRVGSAIVRLRPRSDSLGVNHESFMRLATGLFSHRRKKLGPALEAMGVCREAFAELDRSILDHRAEEIDPEMAAWLSEKLYSK